MIPQLALGHRIPVAGADEAVALGVHGVVDVVVRPIGVAHAEQPHRLIGIVDEGVGQPVARLEADRVAGLQPMKHAVEPDVRGALQHVDELVLGLLGVGPAGAPARRQQLVVNAEAGKAVVPAEGAAQR